MNHNSFSTQSIKKKFIEPQQEKGSCFALKGNVYLV